MTSVSDSTTVDPRLLVFVTAMTISGPVPLAPPAAPVGKAVTPAPGRQVGILTVTTSWAIDVAGRSPMGREPLRYFMLGGRAESKNERVKQIEVETKTVSAT